MPHLSWQLSPGGALIDVWIGPSLPRVNAMKAAGQPPPHPQRVRGLIDTGASCTAIDASLVKAFSLIPTGTTPIGTPSTGTKPHIANQYDILLGVVYPHAATYRLVFEALPVIESTLVHHGFSVLVGRDVLNRCLLVYNGPENIFTLAFQSRRIAARMRLVFE